MASGGADDISEREFRGLISDGSGMIDLGGRRVVLTEPIYVSGNAQLFISNGTVSGTGHSIFQVEGTRSGILQLDDGKQLCIF